MAVARLAVAIVGAGIHGSVVAVRLLRRWPSLRHSLRLVDPSERCLSDWQRRTWGQGMETMRSPGAHHLDVASESLLHYARAHGRERELAMPYHRPSLQLFMDHSRSVVDRYGLDPLVVPTTVVLVERAGEGYRLHGADGAMLESRTLIVAPGLGRHARVPAWARALAERDTRLATHTEAIDVRTEDLVGARVLVVGGGLSAATLACAAVERGAHVTIVSRHRLEARLFDADPGWVGPKYLTLFQSEPDAEARLRMVQRARGRGSVTPELLERLRREQQARRLDVLEEFDVCGAEHEERRGTIRVTFDRDGRRERFHRVWCCTGFEPRLDHLGWLGPLTAVAQCDGRPIVAPSLEISPGCFVSGWLADLWIGPAARNISGARHAARIIADTLQARDIDLNGRIIDAA